MIAGMMPSFSGVSSVAGIVASGILGGEADEDARDQQGEEGVDLQFDDQQEQKQDASDSDGEQDGSGHERVSFDVFRGGGCQALRRVGAITLMTAESSWAARPCASPIR